MMTLSADRSLEVDVHRPGFEPLRLVNKGGPTSALLWVVTR